MIREKMEADLKEAMKAKNEIKVSTLRFLKASFVNAQIDKKGELSDEETIAIIKKQIKQRNESIEGFKKGNRPELADKETKELEILKSYLPEELSSEQLLAFVKEAIEETQAQGPKDMGKVMKVVMAKAKGRADGKVISEMVSKGLSGGSLNKA